jgi:hypothetical protein
MVEGARIEYSCYHAERRLITIEESYLKMVGYKRTVSEGRIVTNLIVLEGKE